MLSGKVGTLPQPVREAMIPTQLQRIVSAQSDLRVELGELERRLAPVLSARPTEPEVGKNTGVQGGPALYEDLGNILDGILQEVRHVRTIMECLEV